MTQEVIDRKSEDKVTSSTDKNEKPEEKAKERRDATPTKVSGQIWQAFCYINIPLLSPAAK